MEILNEILVNLFLFRVLKSELSIFTIPKNWQLYVELANTFDKQFEKQIFYRKYIQSREHHIDQFVITP